MKQLMPKQVGNQLMLNSANFITLTVVLVSHKTIIIFLRPRLLHRGGATVPQLRHCLGAFMASEEREL